CPYATGAHSGSVINSAPMQTHVTVNVGFSLARSKSNFDAPTPKIMVDNSQISSQPSCCDSRAVVV
ncbi:MAG: hypothetical protein AVDCRST_MAG93-2644, partial [uncultured Chloroflexia bacterium]